MEKKLEDYLHLYSANAIEALYTGNATGIDIQKPVDIICCSAVNGIVDFITEDDSYCDTYDKFKPYLRPLNDMTKDEAHHFAWLCMDSRHHLAPDSRIVMDDVEIELVKNDGGCMLDDNVEIYIGVTCRCFEGWVCIMKDGRIGVGEEDEPSSAMKTLDDMADKIRYLLSCDFDLFGLIEAGLAIDKTKTPAFCVGNKK